jgi:hypothetical protein
MHDETNLEQLKSEILRLPTGKARRIGAELSHRVGTYARQKMVHGQRRAGIARELGISLPSLLSIIKRTEGTPQADQGGFLIVKTPEGANGVRLRLPGGALIEGLTLDEIIQIARGLTC